MRETTNGACSIYIVSVGSMCACESLYCPFYLQRENKWKRWTDMNDGMRANWEMQEGDSGALFSFLECLPISISQGFHIRLWLCLYECVFRDPTTFIHFENRSSCAHWHSIHTRIHTKRHTAYNVTVLYLNLKACGHRETGWVAFSTHHRCRGDRNLHTYFELKGTRVNHNSTRAHFQTVASMGMRNVSGYPKPYEIFLSVASECIHITYINIIICV